MSWPPSEVTIAGLRYEIVDNLRELVDEGPNLLGMCDRRRQRIVVDLDQHEQQAAETVVHEVLHALTHVTGLADEWGDETEEQVVSRLAPALAQTIGTNPHLTRWISEAWEFVTDEQNHPLLRRFAPDA